MDKDDDQGDFEDRMEYKEGDLQIINTPDKPEPKKPAKGKFSSGDPDEEAEQQ